jgi:hypothetical protein
MTAISSMPFPNTGTTRWMSARIPLVSLEMPDDE